MRAHRQRQSRDGRTQKALSRKLGVTRMYVSMLESGERRPGLELAAKMEALGICAASDWHRPALCPMCARRIEGGPRPCLQSDCEFAPLFDDVEQDAA